MSDQTPTLAKMVCFICGRHVPLWIVYWGGEAGGSVDELYCRKHAKEVSHE